MGIFNAPKKNRFNISSIKRFSYALLSLIIVFSILLTGCTNAPIRHDDTTAKNNSSSSEEASLQASDPDTDDSSSEKELSENGDSGNTSNSDSTSIDDTTSNGENTTETDKTTLNNTNNSSDSNNSNSSESSSSSKNTTTTTTKPTTGNNSNSSANSLDKLSELRAVWVTYYEINTLLSGNSVSAVKNKIDTAMKNIKNSGFNVVFFHVRANSDAYYKSSYFKSAKNVDNLLNGGLDPLEYAIESAHNQGLQLHAWINPYRIGRDLSYAKLSSNLNENKIFYDTDSVGKIYYYNPADADCRQLIINGVAEIVKNYDVDGIHFDDYFYPQNSKLVPTSTPAEFEKALYSSYQKGGGKLDIRAWRTANVSTLISSVYSRVHNLKSGCAFGVSPRGIVNQSENLYADVQTWTRQKGFLDYIMPQIYYGYHNVKAPFESILNTWANLPRHSSVKLYAGLPLYKSGAKDEYAKSSAASAADNEKSVNEFLNSSNIIKRMVEDTRKNKAYSGVAVFSYANLLASSSSIMGKEVSNLVGILR